MNGLKPGGKKRKRGRRPSRGKGKQSKEINNNSLSVQQTTGSCDRERSTKDMVKPCKSVRFEIDQEVLARWNDGLFYLGKIVKIDEKNLRCSISFEDGSEYWILYKDVQIGAGDKGEIICCICQEETSDKPNEIVLCDNCGLGYHQQCHNPPISGDVLKPDVEFLCRLCVFATNVKKGGALKIGPNAKTFQDMKQSLPYNLHRLTWDAQHKINVEQFYCYCGGPGEWFSKMLQCCRCRQWFHEACIQCLERPLQYGDRFYIFVCSHCNNGPEYIKRLDLKWVDLVQLVLFNLTILQNKKYYDIDEVVVPYVLDNWNDLQAGQNVELMSDKLLVKKIHEICQHHKTRFGSSREFSKKKSVLWGLKLRVPPPAPSVILPTEGQITDEVMGSLQMKGKKTKTFVPIQCVSPIPIKYRRNGFDIDDSIVFKSEKARKLLQEASSKTVLSECQSYNQSYTGYNGYPVHNFFAEFQKFVSGGGSDNNMRIDHTKIVPKETKTRSNTAFYEHNFPRSPRRPKSKKFSLNSAIPILPTYEGSYHPFKTDLEQQTELNQKQFFQQKISDLYETMSLYESCSVSEASMSVCSEGDIDIISTSSTTSGDTEESFDSQPPLALKRKRLKRQLFEMDMNRNVRKRSKQCVNVENVVSLETLEAVKHTEVDLRKLKSKVESYFGAEDRLSKGNRFNVVAKRTILDGKLQYLVEWENNVLKS